MNKPTTEVYDQIKRQQIRTKERVEVLLGFGVKASVADLNGIRIGAKDADRLIGLLRKQSTLIKQKCAKGSTPYNPRGIRNSGSQWCEACKTWMLVCPRCGNNACNGGYGTGMDGKKCTLCPVVYEEQDKAWIGNFLMYQTKLLGQPMKGTFPKGVHDAIKSRDAK